MNDSLSASEAVYGVLAWMTCRNYPVTLGKQYNAAIAAELAGEFCRVNRLTLPRDGWQHGLTHPANDFAPHSPSPVLVKDARATIQQAFQDDPDFRRGYCDNVAMLLHDNGITDYSTRNRLADAIIHLIFE